MEESAAVISIEYSDRTFRNIVLTLRGSNRNDSLDQGCDFEQGFQFIDQTHAAYIYTNNIFCYFLSIQVELETVPLLFPLYHYFFDHRSRGLVNDSWPSCAILISLSITFMKIATLIVSF
ncbi:uncharacterized protein RHIMIDRAFT_261741 [Rhizopus microsporus ATCC 52813]|uniref:Uncharacterized protein n=1 Tax=Rhizopus microsporus ATCC 52813 TaxID=1340429 RepID=A0A2G4SN17_RHIZD|nr:uncharacterized protein RHIMIDRAFT_261741 [Rhizopus microsporus ATCC 52813]PHZ10135.1 hypothetical protein RHIMIDRAFT_261741 [Rhizopus microsporus ATCC 52813]